MNTIAILMAFNLESWVDQSYSEIQRKFFDRAQSMIQNEEYGGAITVLKKVMEIPRSKKYSNNGYTHDACMEISNCYDLLGDGDLSILYARLGRDVYRFRSFCGTCANAHAFQIGRKIERLKTKYDLPDHQSDFAYQSKLKFDGPKFMGLPLSQIAGLVTLIATTLAAVSIVTWKQSIGPTERKTAKKK